MIRLLRKIFDFIFKMDKFLSENKFFGFNGVCVILSSALLLGGIGEFVQDNFRSNLLMNISVFYFGCFISISIPYGIIKYTEIKKYFIYGEREETKIIIKRFELRSYIIFLCTFSWGLIFPMVGIPMLLSIFNVNFLVNLALSNLAQIICCNISIASFLWFSYHVLILEQELSKVKEKLALLTAIITTISTIIANIISGDLKIIISYILLSYVWIRYLIEAKAKCTEA